MLGIIEKSRKFRGLQSFRFVTVKYFSTEPNLSENNESLGKIPRRFVKRKTENEEKPPAQSFVETLFERKFNKEFLVYPSVLNDEELNNIIEHSIDVENFLRDTVPVNSELTSDLLRELKNVELFGLTIPQKYGGAGYGVTESKFLQECVGVHPNIGRFMGHNEDFGIKILREYGSEEQKNKYLPRLASGESFITVALLEDAPLVDFGTINTCSFKDEEKKSYIINGSKKWVQNAHISDLILVVTKEAIINYDSSDIHEGEIRFDINFFILEKNTPGISVYQLKSNASKEFGLHEIEFNNVSVPQSAMIQTNSDNIEILKECISDSQLTSAVVCSSMIKRLIHSAALFCEEKKVKDISLGQLNYVRHDLSLLSIYGYAVESLIYMICGRADKYFHENMIFDSGIAKFFAVETLNFIIQKYMQMIGPDSYKGAGLVEEALKILQFYSIFDQSNSHLKLMIGTSGFVHGSKSLRPKILKTKKPFHFPVDALKYLWTPEKKKIKQNLNLKLKMELHSTLSHPADILEEDLARFNIAVEEHLFRYGNIALEQESLVCKFPEIAAHFCASVACLARASNSFCNDYKNSDMEIRLASLYVLLAHEEIDFLFNQVIRFCEAVEMYKLIGQSTFAQKGYVVEHPLARTY